MISKTKKAHSLIHIYKHIHITVYIYIHVHIYRKLGTNILTSLTAFHVIFRVDYGDHDHALTDIQKWYNQKMDELLLGQGKSGSESNSGRANGIGREGLSGLGGLEGNVNNNDNNSSSSSSSSSTTSR